jgi:hypothetical protein
MRKRPENFTGATLQLLGAINGSIEKKEKRVQQRFKKLW